MIKHVKAYRMKYVLFVDHCLSFPIFILPLPVSLCLI